MGENDDTDSANFVYGLANWDVGAEVGRSESRCSTEVVRIGGEKALVAGKYFVAIYDRNSSTGHTANVVIQLARASSKADMDLNPRTRLITKGLRNAFVFASAMASPEGDNRVFRGRCGPLETVGVYLPHFGYALAMRSSVPNLVFAHIEYNVPLGLSVAGADEDDESALATIISLEPDTFQLVGNFVPDPHSKAIEFRSFTVKLSETGAETASMPIQSFLMTSQSAMKS